MSVVPIESGWWITIYTMVAEGLLEMFMLRSSHCEQQFPTEESSSGTGIVGWDSRGMPEHLLHVL